jgi:hypothetical protein
VKLAWPRTLWAGWKLVIWALAGRIPELMTRLPPAELGEQLALHAWTRLSH